ncbi:ABC-type uncharacterized transport system permease subunit [Bradyrhizobium sp. JR3.5]
MTTEAAESVEAAGGVAPAADPGFLQRYGASIEYILIPGAALVGALAVFGGFIALYGKNPLDLYFYMYYGAFGTWFSWQNTLTRAAPLILTALCTALPAQLGMVIIGGEGALLIGALSATSAALALQGAAPIVVQIAMVIAGMIGGGLWIMLSGGLRQYRGVNETISSLLLVYIALAVLNHLVEGPMRDPASLNKPSTREIGAANMIGSIPGTDVHWGLVFGLVAAVAAYILIYHTTFGFAARVAGGNIRAAKIVGLSVGKLILTVCFLAGSSAGLAGMIEVSRPCRAEPMPTSPRVMDSPASWSHSWRDRIHSRSFRSQSCSAASLPPAACCSAGSACPMRPCWCCKASSSCSCWQATRSTDGSAS